MVFLVVFGYFAVYMLIEHGLSYARFIRLDIYMSIPSE